MSYLKNDSAALKSWLTELGLNTSKLTYQSDHQFLTKETLRLNRGQLTDENVLAIRTGSFTGRSPEDRFIVKDSLTAGKVWWGDINKPFKEDDFNRLKKQIISHLYNKHLYVRDAFAGSDNRYQISLRIINEFPEHNMFSGNMFIEPSEKELAEFTPQWTILHAPEFQAEPERDGTRKSNFAIISFFEKTIIIGGTGYTGEIKKGIFSALNFILPTEDDTLPMHCSANVGEDGNTALFFGLSGTGKTTLSADPSRLLIGDDEHGWTPDGRIFNFEGGCYAKVINLSEVNEPDIFKAIRPGALLENVILKEGNVPDFKDSSITQNTRVSYPLDHINNLAKELGDTPKNIFFLTCDAYGVLPPISKLNPEQAAYHFISGYTAKVAGTETGITKPKAVFSACFGAPFMPLHPAEYAERLKLKMRDVQMNVWLVNTGWIGGGYGVGSRISLKHTRTMIKNAVNGKISDKEFLKDKVFGLSRVSIIEGVPNKVLDPRESWSDKSAYDLAALNLANKFKENFQQFKSGSSGDILAGGPINKE